MRGGREGVGREGGSVGWEGVEREGVGRERGREGGSREGGREGGKPLTMAGLD